MLAYDFMYDNEKLSDKGFIICSFNGGKSDNVSSGSEITFNTVSTLNGAKWELSSIEYKDCLTATIEIMKNPCLDINNLEITTEEIRGIMRWLNRNTFHEFRIINDEYRGFYFNGSFDKIEELLELFDSKNKKNKDIIFQQKFFMDNKNDVEYLLSDDANLE